MRVVSPAELDVAVTAIKAGELVIVPTNRWYMICGNAADNDTCRSIFDGKRRPEVKPLCFVAPSFADYDRYFHLSAEATKLAEAFWPGDLALLLPWRDPQDAAKYSAVGSPALTTNAPGILGELAIAARMPIAATTANISGNGGPDDRGPAVTIHEVEDFLADSGIKVAAAIDGGICPTANHMTIVDCFTDESKLTRTGLIHQRAVAAAIGRSL
jgi:L-threonylcarbamoyladenylate synthase